MMTQTAEAIAVRQDPFGSATTGKLGMWLFIVMDGLSFGGLLIGGAALRASAPTWPAPGEILNVPLTAFNTFLLICTSFTMVMALNSIQKGDQQGLVKFLTATMIGGSIFLGIQIWEYGHFIAGSPELAANLEKAGFVGTDNFLPSTSIYGAVFYATTCFHGLHVLSGVIYITTILFQARKGKYSAENYDRVEILGLFWHFVDLIWIFVFTVIYLI
ncbi:MAG: heme-copper oxidase subunit III [Fidelibacterota bacterium]